MSSEIDPHAEAKRAEQHTGSLATQRMDYTLWKHSTDVHDISDGPFPVGERITVVNSLTLAISTAKLLIRRDPTVAFIDLVPKRPSMYCKKVRVRPRRTIGSSHQTLDPHSGVDDTIGKR